MYRGGASVADGWADRLSAAPFVINTLTCLLIKFKWVQQAEGGIGPLREGQAVAQLRALTALLFRFPLSSYPKYFLVS